MSNDRKIRPALAIPIVAMAFSALFLTFWPSGVFLLPEALNYHAVTIAWALIAVSVIFVPIHLEQKWAKVLASIMAILVVLYSSAFIFVHLIFDGMVGYDLLQETPHGDCTLRLYRGNGGATTSYWLVVREECEYLNLVQTRREHLSRYRAYDGVMTLTDKGLLTLDIEPYGDIPAESQSVNLIN